MVQLFAFLMALILGSVFTGGARAESLAPRLKVTWTCQLSVETQVLCPAFHNNFFDENRALLEEIFNDAEADLGLKVTNQSRPQGKIRYFLTITPNARLDASVLDLPPVDVSADLDPQVTMKNLEMRILVGVAAFREIDSSAVTGGGVISIATAPLGETTGATNLHPENQRFFTSIGAAGSGNAQGSTKTTNLTGSLGLEYFSPNGKFHLALNASDAHTSVTSPVGYGTFTGVLDKPQVELHGVYSVQPHWSFAVLTMQSSVHGSNIDRSSIYSGGVEYALVPYKTTQTKLIMVRVGPTLEDFALRSENSRGSFHEKIASAFAQLVYTNQLVKKRVLLTSLAKAQIYPGNGDYNLYTGVVKVTYQATSHIQLTAAGILSDQGKSFTEPAVIDYSNPLQGAITQQASGPAGVNYSYSFGINYTVGAATRQTQDQRWSGFTN